MSDAEAIIEEARAAWQAGKALTPAQVEALIAALDEAREVARELHQWNGDVSYEQEYPWLKQQ